MLLNPHVLHVPSPVMQTMLGEVMAGTAHTIPVDLSWLVAAALCPHPELGLWCLNRSSS